MHDRCITSASHLAHSRIILMRLAYWGQRLSPLKCGVSRAWQNSNYSHSLALNTSIDNTHPPVLRNILIYKHSSYFASSCAVVFDHYKTAANPHECWPSNTTKALQGG